MNSDPDDLRRTIETAERAVWDALVTGDQDADRQALAPDFLGVYPDGFADRAAHVAQLADGATVTSFDLNDIAVRSLGPDHALIVYHAAYKRPGRTVSEAMYVSSIWHRTPDGWRNIFSQDTPSDPSADLP